MKKFIFVSVLCIFTAFCFGQSKEEKKIASAVSALRQAMLDANQAQLEELTSPDLTYGHSNARIEDRASFVQSLVSGTSDFITMNLSNQTIKVSGKTAIVRHNLVGTTTDSGVPGAPNLSVLLVWQKQGGKWKLLARQAVKVLPQP